MLPELDCSERLAPEALPLMLVSEMAASEVTDTVPVTGVVAETVLPREMASVLPVADNVTLLPEMAPVLVRLVKSCVVEIATLPLEEVAEAMVTAVLLPTVPVALVSVMSTPVLPEEVREVAVVCPTDTDPLSEFAVKEAVLSWPVVETPVLPFNVMELPKE